MISSLIWAPAAGGGTQTIQFKPRNTTTWITYTTVGPTISSLGITGLNYNTLYDFQVINNCPTGSTTVVTGSDVKIQCVGVMVTPSDTAATVQFFDLMGTIDTYVVNLLDAAAVNIVLFNTLTSPFPASITTTFTGLSPLTTYNIQIIPSTFGISNTSCTTVSFKTSNTPTCPAAVGLAVTFS